MPKTDVTVKLVGENGNVFNLGAIVSRALERAGYKEEAKQMQADVMACGSYDEALMVFMNYVEVE